MSNKKESKHIRYLKSLFSEGKINRREFLHSSTMLGLSATAAYAFAGKVSGTGVMPTARAADMPTGGQARIGLRVLDLSSPHTYSWFESEIPPAELAELALDAEKVDLGIAAGPMEVSVLRRLADPGSYQLLR